MAGEVCHAGGDTADGQSARAVSMGYDAWKQQVSAASKDTDVTDVTDVS